MNTIAAGALAFDHPFALLGIALLLPIFLYNYFSRRERRIKKILPQSLRKKLLAARFFFALFLASLFTALAGPRWGIGMAAGEYKRAADAAIAVDVSRSMEICDNAESEESRLERGLSIVREAVAAVSDMRYAVAVSRGKGIVAIPLTWDNGAALGLLEAIDSSSLTGRGTNLESLIDAAAGTLPASGLSAREIILVSDGESLTGTLKAALTRCVQNGIAVTAVAVGSDEGAALPSALPDEIISRRDSTAMRNAAMQTGGVYIDGNSEDAAAALISRLESLTPEARAAGIKREHKPRWFLFAILAIIAYGASKFCLLKIPEHEKKTQ